LKAQTELIPKRLEGKIAVITGGNSGIGLATAQRFVQEGAFVFITGRRQSELDKAVKGRIDILYANAGVAEFAPLGSISESLDAVVPMQNIPQVTTAVFKYWQNIN
jgi:NAD(P)-dependent dehydrogenase (short-subunit alcohol dehydrogenase family)